MINAAQQEAGGLYLFDDTESVQAFLQGPLVAQVTSHPALSTFSVKQFAVMEQLTSTIHSPISERATVYPQTEWLRISPSIRLGVTQLKAANCIAKPETTVLPAELNGYGVQMR